MNIKNYKWKEKKMKICCRKKRYKMKNSEKTICKEKTQSNLIQYIQKLTSNILMIFSHRPI